MDALQLSSSFFLWIKRWFCCACILFLCNGCAWFSVPLCEFDKANVACLASSDSDGGVADLTPQSIDSPLGPLRKFEWRAGINNNKMQKFVGILQGEYAISISGEAMTNFSAVRFHLDRPLNQLQLEETACPKCPLATNIKLQDDSVYVTNDVVPAFWLLRPGQNAASYNIGTNGDLTQVDKNLDQSTTTRPFFHPIIDASVIPLQSTPGISLDAVRLKVGTYSTQFTNRQLGLVTTSMVGDVDATDSVKNGIEVVFFGGAEILSVYHIDLTKGKVSAGLGLASALNEVIASKKLSPADKIGAAYVENLNKDGFIEFVYSLGDKIFVSSYKGKSKTSGLWVFESWGDALIQIKSDEKIQSIMAIDITKDGYPELIVVTDKFVHFYLNTPK